METSVKYRYNADGDVDTVGVSCNIEEIKKSEQQVLYLSFHDQLTGLYNRRFFDEELKRLDTGRDLPVTVVMLDVNGLKLMNDAFGHLIGDKVLLRVANVMKKECRADDIIARVGGDEFMILLSKTGFDKAQTIAKRINGLITIEKVESLNLSTSFGLETKQELSEDIGAVLKKAEDHMYERKLTESTEMKRKTINIIIKTLYERNKEEEDHSSHVSQLCLATGKALDLGREEIKRLRTAGMLHDIGKITIDNNIQIKPAALDDLEWLEVKRHSETGYRILGSVNEYALLAEYVLAHHERWDGKGYPKGLRRRDIAGSKDHSNCRLI